MAKHTNLYSITRTLIPVIYLLLLLFFIWPASGASAGSATLTWDPPIDTPDIDGYQVYYGQVSRHAAGFSNYGYSKFAGNTRSYGIEGLEEGTIYYFAVTTMDISGNESTYSNEVCCTISGSNENQSPKAVFNIDTQAGTVPLVVDFDASGSHDADGGIVEYSWRFGDGKTGEGLYVNHTYVQPGQYTAELTVTDEDGATDTTSVVITVRDPFAPQEIIVDNGDSAFSTVGTWDHSSSIPGYYDVDYQYHAPGTGNKTANWTFEIYSSGVYEISVRWSSYANRAPDATYSIFNNGTYLGDETVDQTVKGGQFIPIGEYSLLPGKLEVILTDEASGYVVADAVKLECVQTAPDSVIVDNSDSAFSTVGTWDHSSSIPGYYDVDYQYHAPGTGNKTANWTFEIYSSGVYEISVRWSSCRNRAPDATYSIFNNGTYLGDETVDQTENGGQFIPIGKYSLLPGKLEVILTDEASGYVVADAVKLELDYEL